MKDKEAGCLFTPDLNEEEIETLRKNGCLFGINVDNKGYLLIGHGQASSGDNRLACDWVIKLNVWLKINRDKFFTDSETFISDLKSLLFLN
ncbi:MAG: hypothetical protein GQ564_08690 [Bacteroidales bacterium]|nr:hypothetical protein [Bacteroidales bacterium]